MYVYGDNCKCLNVNYVHLVIEEVIARDREFLADIYFSTPLVRKNQADKE